MMKKNKTIGSSFDDFLEAEGIAEAVENGAVKKLISFQPRNYQKPKPHEN